MTYKQKPVTVQAFQVTRDIEYNAPDWFMEAVQSERAYIDKVLRDGSIKVCGCTIRTPQGRINAKVWDYIIKEPDGSMQVRKSSNFKKLYSEEE